jgi:chemotaxis protein methyltransferase CheR
MQHTMEAASWDKLIQDICHELGALTGNVFTDKQQPMVESRIRRRMLDLKIDSSISYKSFWKENKETENKFLIGLLTTHFTSFFREFSHFEWLLKELPQIIADAKSEGRTHIKFWSAACSKGQEVWSLCMWLNHHIPKIDPTITWSVLGTDIDPQSLHEAENAVYHKKELETAPRHLWENVCTRGTGDISDWYKLKKDIRKQASFQPMNLLSINISSAEKFDVIMCRNVLIYFNRVNQEQAVKGLLRYLRPNCALITGMSESLTGYGLPLKGVFPSVYKNENAIIRSAPIKQATQAKMPYPMRILCVDDSSTVLMILKKILKAPDFEIVGVALNGEDAIKKMAELKPDAITLDLHMPVMDGPTFLEKTKIAKDLPVIVVSSVARDHNPIVDSLFALGVCDFVEKPSLSTIDLIGEELCQKIKMGWTAKKQNVVLKTTSANLNYRKRPNGQIVFACGKGDEKNLLHVLSQQDWSMDEVTIVYQASFEDLKGFEKKAMESLNRAASTRFIFDVSGFRRSALPLIWLSMKGFDFQKLLNLKMKNDFILLEEGAKVSLSSKMDIDDESPATSFSYLIDKLLGGE